MATISALTENGTSGTNGAAVGSTNSIFDNTPASGPTWITDTHPGGTLAIRLQPQAASAILRVDIGTQADVYTRHWLHVVALPTVPSGGAVGSAWVLWCNWLNGTTNIGGLRINDVGQIQLRDGTSERWVTAAGLAEAGDKFLILQEVIPGSATGHRTRIYSEVGALLGDSGGVTATAAAQTQVTRWQIQQQATTTSPSFDLRVSYIAGDDASITPLIPDDESGPDETPIAELTEDFTGTPGADLTTANSGADVVPSTERATFSSDKYHGTAAMRLQTAGTIRPNQWNFPAVGGGGGGVPSESVKMVYASDVQCQTVAGTRFARSVATSDVAIDLMNTRGATKVVMAGDTVYDGLLSTIQGEFGWPYHWGRSPLLTDFRTVPGNHDYNASREGYNGYFTEAQRGVSPTYYRAEDVGAWRAIYLNITGDLSCNVGSTQYNWLSAELAAHTDKPTFVVWHEARYSIGDYGDNTADAGDAWALLLTHPQVEFVLCGNSHSYQRYQRMNNAGAVDSANGVAQFICAMAGGALDTPPSARTGLAAYNTAYSQRGVVLFELFPDRYTWEFVPATDSTPALTDSGTQMVRVPAQANPTGDWLEMGFFLKLASLPTTAGTYATILNWYSGSTVVGSLQVGSTGALRLRDGSTSRWVSQAIPAGQWIRCNLHVNPGMAAGAGDGHRLQIWQGSNIQGATANQDSGFWSSNLAGATTVDNIRWMRPTEAGVDVLVDYMRGDSQVPPDMSGAGVPSTLTVSLGPDLTGVEPYSTVTMGAEVTGGTGTPSFVWTQTDGPTVTLTGTGDTRSFVAPATRDGDTVTIECVATAGAASGSDAINVAVRPHGEFIYGADGVTLSPVQPVIIPAS